ncbi:MAG: serine hydrolase [Isosphaeraceae bacterium]|nr:serine hydrolase [Isosphaeraceae bacterium]
MRWVFVGLGAVVLVSVLALGALVAWEWTYIDRLRRHPTNVITDVAWYVPREAIAGGDGAALPRARPDEMGMRADGLEEAAKLADAKNASALLVVRGGSVVLERHWRGHRPGDPTNSASMAKTVTSLLVGIAVGEGAIPSIDVPAATWIAAWRGDARRKITLRHLLQMHSGLQPMGAYDEPFSDASYLAFGTDMRSVVDHIPPVAEPGAKFDYNNVNYQALGFVLEAATGRRYAAYLSEKLWKPLGASEASVWLDCKGGSAHASGFLFSEPENWAKIGLMLLHGGEWNGRQIVPREYVKELLRPSPTEPVYALGIWLANNEHQAKEQEQPFEAPGVFYLDGHAKQRVYVVPDKDLVIVRVGENVRGWDEAALPNAVVRALKVTLAPAP